MGTVPTGGLRWAAADTLVITQRALAHWARQPGRLAFGLGFNILLVLMFAFLFGGAMKVPGGGDYREFLMPGMFVMTMLFGIGETVTSVTTDAERGVMDRFRSMPMAGSAVVAGRATADMLYSALTLLVMVACGLAIGWRWHGGLGGAVTAFGLLLLLRFALVWIGIYIGLIVRSQAAMMAVQTLEFPLGFLSSAFVAPSTMPGWLGAVAEWNPLSSTATAARALFGNPGVTPDSWISAHAGLMAVIWPVLLVVVFFPLSVVAFRRLSR
jgi:ABC-type multidrug transport system permease subunit